MSAFETDQDVLNQARNRVSYENYENSLVSWTLSDEWTEPKYRGNWKNIRGMVNRRGLILTLNSCSGEIG